MVLSRYRGELTLPDGRNSGDASAGGHAPAPRAPVGGRLPMGELRVEILAEIPS